MNHHYLHNLSHLRIFVVAMVTLLVLGIVTGNLISLQAILLSIILIFLWLEQRYRIQEDRDTLDSQQRYWLYDLLISSVKPALPDNFVSALLQEELHGLAGIDNRASGSLSSMELGKHEVTNRASNSISPDIKQAEHELVALEDKVAVVTVVNFLVPLLYTFLLIFSNDTILSVLFYGGILWLLADLLTIHMKFSYNVLGWGQTLDELTKQSSILQASGLASLLSFNHLYAYPSRLELHMPVMLARDLPPAHHTMAAMLAMLPSLPPTSRKQVVVSFIDHLRDLPVREQQLLSKQRAYQSRLELTIAVSQLVNAVLAAMISIYLPVLSNATLGLWHVSYPTFYVYLPMLLILSIAWQTYRSWPPTGNLYVHLLRGLGIYLIAYLSTMFYLTILVG